MNVTFRPLGAWRGPSSAGYRKPAPFRNSRGPIGWGPTLTLLKRELAHLDAQEVVIQLDLAERQIRQDGYPRADATPASPGVVVSFDSKYGPLRYACDSYTRWEGNARAIALTLEHLRAVDRYGATKTGEQYAGWKALPPGGSAEPTMSVQHAAVFLCNHAGPGYLASEVMADRDTYRSAYRDAAKLTHPDAGGTDEDFHLLQAAKRALDAHHHPNAGVTS